MSFGQALSGLNVASQNLDVIGNNVANANTVGYKQGSAQFADLFSASLAGGSASQIGLGATVLGVQQQFTQGNLTTTGNPLDLAINGNGFFQVGATGSSSISYTRNGQFSLDKNNNLVNSTGLQVQGNMLNADGTIASTGSIQVATTAGNPVATGTGSTTSLQGVQAQVNLNSGDPVINAANIPFNPSNTSSYNWSTAVSVYDSQGNAHNMSLYFVKTDPVTTPNTWTVHAYMPDVTSTAALPVAPVDVGVPPGGTAVTFGTNGSITGVGGVPGTFTMPISALATGAVGSPLTANVDPLAFNLNLAGSSQFAASDSINSLSQDGLATGQLSNYTVGTNGLIAATYSNGQTKNIAQLLLTTFNNPQGLKPQANNLWTQTLTSGSPISNPPGVGINGTLQSGSTEDSNVNLTTQLVDMITAQRAYQANAQTIKTEDSVMQTLVTLR